MADYGFSRHSQGRPRVRARPTGSATSSRIRQTLHRSNAGIFSPYWRRLA
jgi:hypothetical protein